MNIILAKNSMGCERFADPHDEAPQLWPALPSLFSSVCHFKKYPEIPYTFEYILTHWNFNRSKDFFRRLS